MVSDALELEVQVAVSYHLSPLQESQVLLAVVWFPQHQQSFYSYKRKKVVIKTFFKPLVEAAGKWNAAKMLLISFLVSGMLA